MTVSPTRLVNINMLGLLPSLAKIAGFRRLIVYAVVPRSGPVEARIAKANLTNRQSIQEYLARLLGS
jgi:hypothetical protein